VAFLGEFVAGHGFRGFRDGGLALRRTVLDPILLRRAATLGVRVVEQARVTGLVHDAGSVQGVQAVIDGRAATLEAPLVIGADGLRSVVARRLGLARAGRWPRRVAVVAHYTGVAGIGAHGEMLVFPEGYAGLADVGGGVTNVAVVVPAAQARASSSRTSPGWSRAFTGRRASARS
jgi:flavin-dependent dehydrogenase